MRDRARQDGTRRPRRPLRARLRRARRRSAKRYGDREALSDVSFERRARASGWRSSAPTAPARRRCCRSSRARWRPTAGGVAPPARPAGSRSAPRSTEALGAPRTCGCSRGWRRSPTSRRPSRAMLELTGARARRRRGGHAVGRQPPAAEHRDRPARRPAGAAARRALRLAGSAPARAAVGVHRRAPRRPSSTPRTTSARPSATPTACSCSPTASCCSPARPAELRAPASRRRPRAAFVRFLHERATECAGCWSRTCRSCAARRCWSRCWSSTRSSSRC